YAHRVEGTAWYSRETAAIAVAIVAAIIAIASALARNHRDVLVVATVMVMLVLAPLFFFGYRDSDEGRSDLRPLAEEIRLRANQPDVYYWRPAGMKRASVDLSIYLNRPTLWVGDPATV